MTKENIQLFEILRHSLWDGTQQDYEILPEIRMELRAQTVESLTAKAYPDQNNLKYYQTAKFIWMIREQTEAVDILESADIPVVVIKGTTAGVYYPQPQLRSYGDIDLLVQPEHYCDAVKILCAGGWQQNGDVGNYHTALYKNNQLIELHRYPGGIDNVKEGSYILQYMLSGFSNIQQGIIAQPACSFPMLPWQQNGLELIWHFRVHLYNGIGLRHVIDWMMFVNACLDDKSFREYGPVLEKSGLLLLAKIVARMCQLYLGLPETITWCKDVDDTICTELMDFIMDQGNFGHKRFDDKAAKVLTKYRDPLSFLKGMQHRGLYSWPAARKHLFLRPFAWIYVGIQGARAYFSPEGRKKLNEAYAENLQRRKLFNHLYGDEIKNVPAPHVVSVSRPDLQHRVLRQKIRPIYEHVAQSPLRTPLYYLQELYFFCHYQLYRSAEISEADRENVEQNVTFIFKSFNRQKKAKALYKSIKRYYPKAHVVIADDSEEPLQIDNMIKGDIILHLPFNSGLSKGLIAALEKVRTPYVMRMDDDQLLISRSNVHDQLAFLQSHSEIDLSAVQMTNRWPEKHAAGFSRIRMRKGLLIPAGTIIDGHEVVYKTPNVYLAKTEAVRKVGYDPNIRMIDHYEFFLRAAGEIVCVQDPHSYVLHCHNLFEEKMYRMYRRDYGEDVAYIARKHGLV